jgi:hypothetical protein
VNIPEQTVNDSVYVFLVDCTGSMSTGRKLEITKETLKLFIQSLPSGCLFEIVSFGGNFRCRNPYLFLSHYKKGLTNNDKIIDFVRKYIDKMYADPGGRKKIF